jgi:peroxiredoxin Q/BCP
MKIFTQILTAISAGVFASGANAAPIAVGSSIPSIAQKNQDGETVKLAEVGAEGYLLVYFYPKADTPGCTKQACSLRDSYAALSDKGVKIYGVSTDSIKSQKAFQGKYKLPFDLLADAEGTVVDAFGVPKTLGFSKRQAFLFHNGKLVWSDLSASTEQQAADVLKYLAKP